MLRKVLYVIIAIIIASTLINNDYFCNSTLAAYFFYTISASILIIFSGLSFIKNKTMLPAINYTPLVLFFLLAVYYLLQGLFANGSINIMQTYLFATSLLLICLTLLFKNENINTNAIFNIITIAAVVESLICILQFVGVLSSRNDFLQVSGTWGNPNVTAMFLAMSIPATLSNNKFIKTHSNHSNQYKVWLQLVSFVFICLALVLLKCRTAILGTLVIITIVANHQYRLFQKLKAFSFFKRFLYIIFFILIIISVGFYAYKAKQNSADGRKLVWKISATMFMQNPITGIGYGYFEHDYNLQQAKYFASGSGTTQEKNNASFVNMAYNEFLQNGVEGGIIALFLFSAFIISLLLKFPANKGNEQIIAYSGIVGFILMSIVNFTIQAVPVLCLFIIYVASLCAEPFVSNLKSFIIRINPLAFGLPLFALGLFLFFSQISLAKAFTNTKNAIDLSNDGDYAEAINILEPLQNQLENSEKYWMVYGRALYGQKQYSEALDKFHKASGLTSDPVLYIQIGNCNYWLKHFDSAIIACTLAKNIAPNRLIPRYALMKIYQRINDSVNMIKTANEIIVMQPKGVSTEAKVYKSDAAKLLGNLHSKIQIK